MAEETTRHDAIGPVRVLAVAEGYVMARRPHCSPFVLREGEWSKLPSDPLPAGTRWPRIAGDRIDTGPDENGSFT